MKIQGSVAIVTGGAQGIGEHICRALLERGGKVAILDVDTAKGIHLKERLEKKYGPGEVMFIACDVTSSSQMKDSFKEAAETFGHIDIVCNNAGIASLNEKDIWERMVDVNVKGVLLGQFLGILHMGHSHGGKGGTIVNVASMAALIPQGSSQCVYTATKYAVLGLTQSSKDLKEKEGIRVNCICPSFTATQLVDKMTANPELLKKESPENYYIVFKKGLISPDVVASGILQLIEDESKNASVMMVTKAKGIEILEPRKPLRMRKSKL